MRLAGVRRAAGLVNARAHNPQVYTLTKFQKLVGFGRTYRMRPRLHVHEPRSAEVDYG